jgi:hypothetical protein
MLWNRFETVVVQCGSPANVIGGVVVQRMLSESLTSRLGAQREDPRRAPLKRSGSAGLVFERARRVRCSATARRYFQDYWRTLRSRTVLLIDPDQCDYGEATSRIRVLLQSADIDWRESFRASVRAPNFSDLDLHFRQLERISGIEHLGKLRLRVVQGDWTLARSLRQSLVRVSRGRFGELR